MQTRTNLLPLIVTLLLLHGCGGGGGGGGTKTTTSVRFSVAWSARSRAVNAPSSALSAVLTLANANPASGDFTYIVNRDAAPTAYTGNYTTTTSAKVGTWPLTMRLYAQADGSGAVVGIAQANVTIASNGTGIGNITTTATIASVEIPTGQSINIGETKDLTFTAKDALGNIVAVTPGSAFFTIVSGADKLQLPDGKSPMSTGVALGLATVTATVDGKTSGPVDILVRVANITSFTITDLGMYTGKSVYVTAINNHGQIVGSAGTFPNIQAIVWQAGNFTSLSTPVGNYSAASDINDASQIVGTTATQAGANHQVVLWQSGSMSQLDLDAGDLSSRGPRINNNGQVVGVDINSPHEDMLWNNGQYTRVTNTPDEFDFWGINNKGQLAGRASPFATAAVWDTVSVTALGTPSNSDALALNDVGQVVGQNGGAGTLWQNATATSLGTVNGKATTPAAINNFGQVVGDHPNYSNGRAWLWQNGVIKDLNTMIPPGTGWVLENAVGINALGQVVGNGTLNGQDHAYLLTPK